MAPAAVTTPKFQVKRCGKDNGQNMGATECVHLKKIAFHESLPKRLSFGPHCLELCHIGSIVVNGGYVLPAISPACRVSLYKQTISKI